MPLEGTFKIAIFNFNFLQSVVGHTAGGAVGRGTALQAGKSRVLSPTVSLEFFIDKIIPVALWPWG